MENIRAAIKLLGFGIMLTLYFVTVTPLYPFLKLYPYRTRKILLAIIKLYCRITRPIIGLKLKVDGQLSYKVNHFIVCNHMSYLDVLLIYTVLPSCFITSVEMRETPVLGQICELAGCLFVERRNKRNLHNEIQEVTEALKNGLDVVIFPEATSTNGEQILRFKRPLFQAAFNAGVDLLPMCLNYKTVNGQAINKMNRDRVCWYGDMEFLPHLWSFLKNREVAAHLTIVEPVTQVENRFLSTSEISEHSYQLVSQQFCPIT